MPGIDKSRFTNLSADEVELLCGICSAIFVDPVVTPCCRQTYCQTCIKQWLRERKTCPHDKLALTPNKLTQPPRLVINLLNKLIIKCEFQANGCVEEIHFNRYKQHLRSCRFNPNAKCADCDEPNGEPNAHNCVQILVEKNKSLEASNKKLSRGTLNLKKRLSNKSERLAEKDEQLSETNDELEKTNKELTKTIDELNDLIQEKNEKLDETTKTVAELRALNTKLIEKNNTVNELTVKLNEKNVLVEKFKNFSGLLNEENQKIEKEKQVLRQKVNKLSKFEQQFSELKNEFLKFENSFGELKKGEQSELNNNSVSIIADQKPAKVYVKTLRLSTLTKFSYTQHILSVIFTSVNGLQWKLKITFVKDGDLDYLGLHLVCIGDGEPESDKWSCKASVEFRILSQTDNRNKYLLKSEHVFTNDQHICGYSKFMPWVIITDKSMGYVKDDHIILEVVITY